jgi:hypothetical protein
MGVSKERMVHCDIECLTMSGVSLVCGDWYTLSEDKSQKKYLKSRQKYPKSFEHWPASLVAEKANHQIPFHINNAC